MKFARLYEAETKEDPVYRMLSKFVEEVNALYDLVNQEIPDDMSQQLSKHAFILQSMAKEIGRTPVSPDLWTSMRTQYAPKTWTEFRQLVSGRMIPTLVAKIKKLVSSPIAKDDLKLKVVIEDVAALQEMLTGLAANSVADLGKAPALDNA